MRSLIVLAACLCALSTARADILTLQAPVELRASPGRNYPVVVIAPADTQLTVLGVGKNWIPVSLNGLPFYASRAALTNATPSDTPGADPTCDYGYPYSGSGLFFARPLAQLRHSGPLGALLGTHRYYPC
jgi:S-formylglutathione hydrolase FrmB